MLHDWIGHRSNKMKNTVERGAVKKFAEAIGDPHPVYIDETFAAASRYKRNIAPPTFPRVFDYGEIEGLSLPAAGLIHGEQTFSYERPLFVGEEIYCYSEAADYYEKTGKTGTLGFLVLKSFGEDAGGRIVFESTQVVIITEAVRKEMTA